MAPPSGLPASWPRSARHSPAARPGSWRGTNLARRQLTLDNSVAAELAGSEDSVLRSLRERLPVELHLRGNVLTLDGDPAAGRGAAGGVDELVELIEQGHDVAPGTIEAVA